MKWTDEERQIISGIKRAASIIILDAKRHNNLTIHQRAESIEALSDLLASKREDG